MTIRCPHCSETETRTRLKQPFNFTFGLMVLGFLGGMVGGLFYGLGQQSKFECGRCHQVFFSHTIVSRVFFVLCLITYATVGGVIAYGIWDLYRGH